MEYIVAFLCILEQMKKKDEQKQKVLVIVGPTASGKSDLAVFLAKQFDGEVVSADSRQVYRGLDIGTGKITKREMQGVPHHLLDVASAKRSYTVAHYKRDGAKAIDDILRRGKIPIICGGTGFYIQALVDDLLLPDVKPNIKLRKQLEELSCEELFMRLKRLDKARAKTIDAKNPYRLIRAIEIAEALGKVPPFKKNTPYNPLIIGIEVSKETLEERIHLRLMKRLKRGMLAEIKTLHENGLSWKRMEELGLEYRYTAQYLQGKFTKKEFQETLEQEIKKYAKRQMTWFKKDKRINWIPFDKQNEALALTKNFLKRK